MTKERAAAIRAAHLRGEPVKAVDLQQACHVLAGKRSGRMRIPALRDEVRSRVNLVLMFNLGKAIGQ